MPTQKTLSLFFKKVEGTYAGGVHSLKSLMEHNKLIYTSHSEINFVLMILAKLRLDFKQDSSLSEKILEEALKGGHIQFKDSGSLYNELLKNFNSKLKKRYSSHSSILQQYSFSGSVVKEVLIGVSKDKEGKQSTWIQLEKHHTKSFVELILHLFDYLTHKWTGKNVGPFGESVYTEQTPLIVRPV
jgi:hypothetical protein